MICLRTGQVGYYQWQLLTKQFLIISPTICPPSSLHNGLGWTDFELAKVTAQLASTDGESVKNLIAAVDKHKQGHTVGNTPV